MPEQIAKFTPWRNTRIAVDCPRCGRTTAILMLQGDSEPRYLAMYRRFVLKVHWQAFHRGEPQI